MKILIRLGIRERIGFVKGLQMVFCFITRAVRENQKSDVVLPVTSSTITLDDICLDRLN